MSRDLTHLTQKDYDVIVIGGGINGAAIAHLAALNSKKVLLLEKGDFASGTSSKSTKLLHGGLRYLENFHFGLVKQALRERFIHLRSSPHLTKVLQFIIPIYKNDARPFWMIKLGVRLYDFLSLPAQAGGKQLIKPHRVLTLKETTEYIPGIKKQGLIGSIMYADVQMDDARIVLENVLMAKKFGADIVNYVKVEDIVKNKNGQAVAVKAYDFLKGQLLEIKAQKIICAVGAWSNNFFKKEVSADLKKIRTTKGIHVVYRGEICRDALLIPTQKDGRVFFIIPWHGNSLIGTTDTDFNNNPDEVEAAEEDIDYLLKEAQRIFSDFQFKKENIITTFAGLRPLLDQRGDPSKLSREHKIEYSDSGILHVLGGKYTTYRKIAEDALKGLGINTINTDTYFPLYGSGEIKDVPEAIAQKYQLPLQTIKYLMSFYGTRYIDVVSLTEKDSTLKEPICTCSPIIRAQVVYAIETEMAVTSQDIICRRLPLGFIDCPTHQCRRVIKEIAERINIK